MKSVWYLKRAGLLFVLKNCKVDLLLIIELYLISKIQKLNFTFSYYEHIKVRGRF